MASWSEILNELDDVVGKIQAGTLPADTSPFDYVRRKYLAALNKHTGRNVIVYATNWASGEPGRISISPEDMPGFMEVIRGVKTRELDLILHSPGGSGEAAEAIVKYLRSKFDDIRVIIPHAAMSAATMLACAGNRIVMGRHSFIGPIDPQMIVRTEFGFTAVPAHAVLQQFERAKKECKDNQDNVVAWIPMLRQYGPALLVQCTIAQDLSISLATEWLAKYMFAKPGANLLQRRAARRNAKKVARRLADHSKFKTHGRFLSREDARKLGLSEIDDLESSQEMQEAVLSVFHATNHTFAAVPVVKLIENHLGKAFMMLRPSATMSRATVPPPAAPPPGPP